MPLLAPYPDLFLPSAGKTILNMACNEKLADRVRDELVSVRRCLSATILLLITGCAYEIEEIYYKEIPPPVHEITFTLNKYDDADTIFLSAPEIFTYEVRITPGKIEQVRLLLDDQVLLTSQGGKINYPFEGDLLQDGIYRLTISFVASPGTGSLAENTGVEKLNLSRTWVLKIDS